MVALASILVIPLIILYGWVLRFLWQWFFVPVLGLPQIRLVEAIGIALVVNFFLYRTEHFDEENKQRRLIEKIISGFTIPLTFLAMGWIVKSFM